MTNHLNVHRLYHNEREFILIGTAHVSRESADLVKTVIEEEKPDTVCVELCESRFQAIRQKDKWQEMDIVKVIKEKKSFLLLSNLILASFQKKIAEKLDVRPGEEMIKAIETAESVGASIQVVDRDVRTTLLRTWRIMGFIDKLKILYQLLGAVIGTEEISKEEVERLKQEDMLEVILADVEKSLPVVRTVVIDERDRYMASKIKAVSGNKVVAVVGAGHIPGILKYWNTDQDVKNLETIPPTGRIGQVLKWIIPTGIAALVIFGFFYGGSKTGTEMITRWVLANGILAGIGALIAFAHPMTIVSAIIAAPITSMNPMVAAGWVSGLVEAFSRKPKVKDFERLSDDIQSVKGFWKNNITRILLVVVFTNLGSTIGTLVAIPMMANLIGH